MVFPVDKKPDNEKRDMTVGNVFGELKEAMTEASQRTLHDGAMLEHRKPRFFAVKRVVGKIWNAIRPSHREAAIFLAGTFIFMAGGTIYLGAPVIGGLLTAALFTGVISATGNNAEKKVREIKPVADGAELIQAAMIGDVDGIGAFLRKNPGLIGKTDENRMNALHWAAYGGEGVVVDKLLAYPGSGALLSAKDKDGNTPLMLAVRENQLFAAMALGKCMDVSDFGQTNADGQTARDIAEHRRNKLIRDMAKAQETGVDGLMERMMTEKTNLDGIIRAIDQAREAAVKADVEKKIQELGTWHLLEPSVICRKVQEEHDDFNPEGVPLRRVTTKTYTFDFGQQCCVYLCSYSPDGPGHKGSCCSTPFKHLDRKELDEAATQLKRLGGDDCGYGDTFGPKRKPLLLSAGSGFATTFNKVAQRRKEKVLAGPKPIGPIF